MEWRLGYAAVGAAVGFFAGLLGIGGGAIMVPLPAMLCGLAAKMRVSLR